jgi:HEAT repeat protein
MLLFGCGEGEPAATAKPEARSVEELLFALTANKPETRVKAVAAFASHYPRSSVAVPVLVDVLDDDAPAVREAAALVLCDLGHKGLANYVDFLGNPEDPAHAPFLKAGETVLMLGAAVTPTDLQVVMASSGSAAKRRAGAALTVVVGWTQQDMSTTLDVLADIAQHDPDTDVRDMAAASLTMLGWSYCSANHPPRAGELDRVRAVLVDGKPQDKLAAICIAGLLRPREGAAIEAVQAMVQDEAVGMIAEDILHHGEVRDIDKRLAAYESVFAALDAGKRPPIPLGALAWPLRHMGAKASRFADPLARHMASAPGPAHVELARTLLAISPDHKDEVAKSMVELYRSAPQERPWVRIAALELLAELGAAARPAKPIFVEVLGASEKKQSGSLADRAKADPRFGDTLRAKRAAAFALGAIGADPKLLTPLLKHPDARVRYRAAKSLRQSGG